MSSKQKKYSDIINTYKIFQNNKNNFFLIVHTNNLNSVEALQIKNYCVQNCIESLFVKLNLLKKITKNQLFINLMAGPTKIFFFPDLISLFNFTNITYIKKKIIPLAIYWNNNFYNYNFIEIYLKKNLLIEKSLNLNFKIAQIQLISLLKNNNFNYIYNFNNNLIKTLLSLINSMIKKNT